MFKNGDFINCEVCVLCFRQIVKSNRHCCNRCQARTSDNKALNSKVYKIKFNKNSNSLFRVCSVSRKYIESNFSSDNLNSKQNLSLIKHTHKAFNIHNYEWSNFKKFEEFGNYAINSNQYPIMIYIISWGNDQGVPRIKSFVSNHINNSNAARNKPKPHVISVTARPLLMISQESFWIGLVKSYLKFVHPNWTLFSLSDFNPRTTPKYLLSAIYFAGFVIQPNFPEEIAAYMNAYAINNIKKIMLSVKLSSAQALGLYSYAFYLSGNSSLSRVCSSHFIRMNQALGIGINRKSFSSLEQYNRKLVNINMRLYDDWVRLEPSSCELASKDDEDNLEIDDPKYQFPDSSLNLPSNQNEGSLYSVYCCQYGKIQSFVIDVISKLSKYDSKKKKKEIDGLFKEANDIYNDAKSTLESVISLVPECKSQKLIFFNMLKAAYITSILCIYSKVLETLKNRNFCITQAILEKGTELWELISSGKVIKVILSITPYIIGFHLIQAYPHSSKEQKKSIMLILKSIINSFYKEDYDCNPMNFLMLQTQFNLISTK